jgi:hypothetical protein
MIIPRYHPDQLGKLIISITTLSLTALNITIN